MGRSLANSKVFTIMIKGRPSSTFTVLPWKFVPALFHFFYGRRFITKCRWLLLAPENPALPRLWRNSVWNSLSLLLRWGIHFHTCYLTHFIGGPVNCVLDPTVWECLRLWRLKVHTYTTLKIKQIVGWQRPTLLCKHSFSILHHMRKGTRKKNVKGAPEQQT